MKVGFDISQAGKMKAGCGFFADSLIRHLVQKDSSVNYLLYRLWGNSFFDPQYKKIHPVEAPNVNYINLKDHDRYTFDLLGYPDIIHANNFFCPNYKINGAKLVYTLYDLSFIEHPEYTTEENRLICLGGMFNASLFADHIVSISEFSKAHFLKIFPYYLEKNITVTHLGTRFLNKQSTSSYSSKITSLLSKKFILSIGTLEPRKNHISLIKAYKKLKEQGKINNIPLVLAGQEGWLFDSINVLIEELDLSNDIIKLGRVDDHDLAWLYQHCFFMVYPSLFEGFGLPILEAMSLGAAVISSNVTSMPEIVADAGLLVDPYNINELTQAMLLLLENESTRLNLKEKALKRSALFSWDKTAESVLSLYRKLYEENR